MSTPRISSTSTWIIRFQLGHVEDRQWVWDSDEEIVITTKLFVTYYAAQGLVRALYGMDAAILEIQVERL